jgi:hypothetical protein
MLIGKKEQARSLSRFAEKGYLHWARADSNESADLESLESVISNIGILMEMAIMGEGWGGVEKDMLFV